MNLRKIMTRETSNIDQEPMSKERSFTCYVGDFETTVYKGQTNTEVWASALVPFYSENVQIFHSIDETFEAMKKLGNIRVYYHNLKFDGSFWIDFLLNEGYTQAYENIDAFIEATMKAEKSESPESMKDKLMPNKSFNYVISDLGQWYMIKIKINNHIIELRDSLKLLPFSVKQIGESFGTKHRKLDMEYEGVRYAGCEITEDEQKYIANDVLVVKEALELMYKEGHDALTIGSCCLKEYKKIIGKETYDELFPNLYEMPIDSAIYGAENAGEYVKKSYAGGWCYVVPEKQNKVFKNGVTADVNSLYPSMMHSESGNRYPVGHPTFWSGNHIPMQALKPDKFYFIRIKTRFYIKAGMLPFIHIKNSHYYRGTESLESSDIIYNGEHYTHYHDEDGNIIDTSRTMTMTQTEFQLFTEHYDTVDFEILDGCYFNAKIGIFDDYINKWREIKITSKGARRTLAKLFLNNLYGKMAANMDSSFKVAFLKEDGTVGFMRAEAHDKTPGYIPVGSAITAYARNFTIRAAQANYYGKYNRGFIYADTDSIHCDLKPEELKNVPIHPVNFCNWKLESYWDTAIFTRQKTYIEHVTHEDGEPVDEPYYNIKCAGMPDKCKRLFNISLTTREPVKGQKYTQEELDFIKVPRTLSDFKIGLRVPGKLLPKRIKGGILLVDTPYEMR
jgi:hypothetical protein